MIDLSNRDLVFALLVFFFISLLIHYSFISFYKIEVDSYDKRMIAFYDSYFEYLLLKNNGTDVNISNIIQGGF